jgi:hypothetical protein
VKENGCFGCHEISGRKSGREVGPDLRLELSPALESMPPADQAKVLADTENPPGMMRKVGPEPLPAERKDKSGLGPQVDCSASRLPADHQNAALLRPEQQ